MDYSKLESLVNLKKTGEISEEEFQFEKARLKADRGSAFARGHNLNLEEYYFLMILHLTQFSGLLVPFIGKLVPIVLWLRNKDHNDKVDLHGRIVFNWIFSVIIYCICSIVLSSVAIGMLTLGILIILDIVFPLVAAFKARKGIAWNYPLSIQFFRVNERIMYANSNFPPAGSS